jgi:ADP-heptose:LPS heptosyltransferase
MSRHKRILVVRTDRIGDVVLATPLIRALRETFPDAYLAALVNPYARDVLLGNPHINEILTDDPKGRDGGRRGFWRQVRALRSYKFDTALLLLPTERLAWMLFASGIRTRVSVGLKLYEVLTFMKTVSRHKYIPLRHEADYCLDLGRAIGVREAQLVTQITLTEEERQKGREMLRSRGLPDSNKDGGVKTVIIHPGSAGSSPNWKVEEYVELARFCLEDERVWIVITGSPNETQFSGAFAVLQSQQVIDLIGQLSIRELCTVIAAGSLVISSSTGPMHLAAGLGVPTVSMFCRMSACSVDLWGPLGNSSEIVRPSTTYCATQCPGDPHICQFVGGIDPEAVYKSIVRALWK